MSILAKYKVLFQCDNLSLVDAIHKGSSKDKVVMHLLRCLWFFTAYFEIELNAEHIAGVSLLTVPLDLPPQLLQIVAVQDLDWTSTGFNRIFKDILNWVQPPPHGDPIIVASSTS